MGVLIFIMGLCIGSFLNVCIYRIPREESIAFPASHCTSCGYELKARDLIPVISYIFLKGKCRGCKEKISIKYPLIELTNALLYLSVYLKFGLNIDFIFYSLLISVLIVIAMIDFKTKYVYFSTILFGLILDLIYIFSKWYFYNENIFNNIVGGIIGFVAIYLIVVLTRGMGQGDAEIAGICGLALGINGIGITLFLSFIIGGIVGAIILILKLKNRKDEMAFGPYLVMAAMLTIFFGNNLLSIYVKSFIN